MGLGTVFMPDLDEGSLLFMPTTAPSININEAKRAVQLQDGLLARNPEVAGVLGKVGRIESSTDPAPVSMIETIVALRPRREWPDPGLSRDDLIARLDGETVSNPGRVRELLDSKQPGDAVNLETDIFARYVEQILEARFAPQAGGQPRARLRARLRSNQAPQAARGERRGSAWWGREGRLDDPREISSPRYAS